MTPRPKTIGPEEDLKVAAQQMLYLEVHRLFVEVDGELQGVISQSDIVRAVATATL
jgi:CBS domain-containing protein